MSLTECIALFLVLVAGAGAYGCLLGNALHGDYDDLDLSQVPLPAGTKFLWWVCQGTGSAFLLLNHMPLQFLAFGACSYLVYDNLFSRAAKH